MARWNRLRFPRAEEHGAWGLEHGAWSLEHGACPPARRAHGSERSKGRRASERMPSAPTRQRRPPLLRPLDGVFELENSEIELNSSLPREPPLVSPFRLHIAGSPARSHRASGPIQMFAGLRRRPPPRFPHCAE